MNTGDGSVAPSVEGLNKKCNIRFTVESLDVENGSKNDAVEEAIALTDRKERLPCAVIGHVSKNSAASALVLGIRGIPQMSPSSGSPALDDKSEYPLFSRTSIAAMDASGVPWYAMGFGFGAKSDMPEAMFKAHALTPKLVVINADPFFSESAAGLSRKVLASAP